MPSKILDLSLAYIRKMTDETGMLEHAKFSEPNKPEGYTTDDNARAYQAMLKLDQPRQIYLDFLQHAIDTEGLHNDMNEQKEWMDKPGLGEWFGRAMVAVGQGMKTGDQMEKRECQQIWDQAKSAFTQVTALRTMAQLAIAGVPHMADKLKLAWEENRATDWEWPEPGLYYDNGRLPQALFAAGFETAGRKTLDWLIRMMWDDEKNCFNFVGQAGWWKKSESRAVYDQQPIEAGSMVEACVAAYVATRDKKYLDWANKAWEWYFGRNIKSLSLWDEQTGGVRDGLSADGVNMNEGAEAVLSFVLAGISLSDLQ